MARGSLFAQRIAYATVAERRRIVARALRAESGNKARAAARLGVGRSTINRWIDADDELGEVVRAARTDPKKGAKG